MQLIQDSSMIGSNDKLKGDIHNIVYIVALFCGEKCSPKVAVCLNLPKQTYSN